MKIQGVSGNLFFKYGLREVFEAGIFGEDMTEKPGKCEADNKKKSQNSGGEFWSVCKKAENFDNMGTDSSVTGDFYYIIENFSVVCEIFGSMALRLCVFCVQD